MYFSDAESDPLSSASYSPSSSSDYLNVSDEDNENLSPKTDDNQEDGLQVEPTCPSPETLQSALDALFSEVSLLSSDHTNSKETTCKFQTEQKCTPKKVHSAIPDHFNNYEQIRYHYYGVV